MNLTEAQTDALVELGESATGHDFMSKQVLRDLLALNLVYWRNPDELDFSPAGEQIYDELTGSAERVWAVTP